MGDDLDPSQRYYQWWGNTLNFIIGQWFTDSNWNSNLWNECPQRIRSAYLLIDNIHTIPGQGVTEADVERMKNESRFLIAYYYWMMLEAYGSVPFFDSAVDVDDPNLMKGQMSFDEMVDWIGTLLVRFIQKVTRFVVKRIYPVLRPRYINHVSGCSCPYVALCCQSAGKRK